MLFGSREYFAIECYNDSNPVNNKQVFGRMCVWIKGKEYGNITEPSCMLNVTENHLVSFVQTAGNFENSWLCSKNDQELYEFLDRKIYLDDDRTDEQIQLDLMEYSKYEFLANGGESFDFGKSFVVKEGEEFRFVFTDKSDIFHGGRVCVKSVMESINSFFCWIDAEKDG